MDKAKARKRAAALAIVVLVALWVVIYVGYVYLRRPLGEELAGLVRRYVMRAQLQARRAAADPAR